MTGIEYMYGVSLDHPKLVRIAEIEDYPDVLEMLEEARFDGIAPAICCNEDCDYIENMEPDQDCGWCVECQEGTLKSCLVLAGVI